MYLGTPINRAGAEGLVKYFVEFLGSGLENVPHQYNFVVAMADDRRVTRGGPAAVLERSMLGKKTQLDPCLAAKMDPAALD